MVNYKGYSPTECLEDCPRCNRCSPESKRRMRMDAMIRGWELEKLRYEADGLPFDLPSATEWHAMAEQAVTGG